MNSLFIKKTWLYRVFLLFASVFLCFFQLGEKSLTLDEVSTITFTRDFAFLKHVIWTDEGNMWLYYMLIHFWLKMGDSEFVIRSFSAVAGVCSAVMFYFFAREAVREKTARIAAPFFITNLYFIYYAQLARSYSLALFLSIVASYFFVKFIKNTSSTKYLVLYSIVSILMIYTYVLTTLLIAAQFASVLLLTKTPWKKMILAALSIGVGIAPLFLAPAFHGHQVDWLQKPSFVQLPLGIIALGGDSLITAALACLLIGGFVLTRIRTLFAKNTENSIFVGLLLSALFPVVFGFFFSVLVKPVYEAESFNTSLPAFVLLLALALEKLSESQKRLFYVLYLVLLVFENKGTHDWKAAEKLVEQEEKRGDAVIFYSYYIRYPFEYYLKKSTAKALPKSYEIASAAYALGGGAALPTPDTHGIDALARKHSRVWLVLAYDNLTWLGRSKQWQEVESELKRYYREVEDKKVGDIEIKLFVRKRS
jgi:4-amino-4-deoxy-L-arabinose transferase-like glycosyltransferase